LPAKALFSVTTPVPYVLKINWLTVRFKSVVALNAPVPYERNVSDGVPVKEGIGPAPKFQFAMFVKFPPDGEVNCS
jgi:hypothetical protein